MHIDKACVTIELRKPRRDRRPTVDDIEDLAAAQQVEMMQHRDRLAADSAAAVVEDESSIEQRRDVTQEKPANRIPRHPEEIDEHELRENHAYEQRDSHLGEKHARNEDPSGPAGEHRQWKSEFQRNRPGGERLT